MTIIMDKLRIWFTDFWPEWKDEDFISPILKNHFKLVLDKNNPDVVFHSIFNRMQEAPKYKCKKILYLGENWRPEQFRSDYSISFDPHSDTNYRLPLWQVYILRKPELMDRLYERRRLEIFERFCSFTVSNPNNFMRNGFFQQLNQYKRVHSYGKVLSNDFSLQKLSGGKYWRDAKDEFFMHYSHKFSIVFENTPFKGYTTEKLMDAFLAGSLPIYFGNPKIAEEFNEKAFINVNKIGIMESLDLIKQMESDINLFNQFYNEPVFLTEQKEKLEKNLTDFEQWLIRIVK
jgi:alpha(1,3/1,4) fucosyltransferase